jgi:hypothetical protein
MRTPAFSVAVLALLTTGCGDSDSDQFVDEYCDSFKTCCSQAMLASDGQLCRATWAAVAGKPFNAAAADDCLADLRVARAKADWCQDPKAPASCKQVFQTEVRGTKKPGEACTEAKDCAASTEGAVVCQTSSTGGTQTRICQLLVRGKVGDTPCVGTVQESGVTIYDSPAEAPVRKAA